MKIKENAQWIVIPMDIDSAIVIASPPNMLIRFILSILDTWPL